MEYCGLTRCGSTMLIELLQGGRATEGGGGGGGGEGGGGVASRMERCVESILAQPPRTALSWLDSPSVGAGVEKRGRGGAGSSASGSSSSSSGSGLRRVIVAMETAEQEACEAVAIHVVEPPPKEDEDNEDEGGGSREGGGGGGRSSGGVARVEWGVEGAFRGTHATIAPHFAAKWINQRMVEMTTAEEGGEEGAEKEEGTGEGESNSDKAATINPGWFHVRQRELAFPRLESPMKGGRLSGEAVEYETGIVAGSVGLRTTCGAGRGC